MASKRRLRRKACEGKLAFETQTEAVKALIGLRARGHAGNHSYRCEHCHHWHVGHTPKRARRAMADAAQQRARRG